MFIAISTIATLLMISMIMRMKKPARARVALIVRRKR